ncbi:Na+/H+ antiporter subunit E [Candidatus Sulfidibacterium hydrothermale]|uniref:Na+/H+ antiporter subunit E n=1 Tax=Candidatus Sulfidibacterium hydrothermale TaxID=2875962 RepID=UPI001F0AAB54|nr:Na+/H+ antiporter subunit E [Candidatus Sulfidibacterium hydrothermale]UBM62723.1 Na+/H+ antiporter subunit E [Candidatus Sulfidibacterium hydrothermale]
MQSLTFNQKLGRFIVNWIFLFLVWLMFTSTLFWQEVLIGAVVSMLISLASIRLFTCCTLSILNPVKIFWMVWYFFVFLKLLIIANLDVAKRVISPSLPINPGIVKFKTKLKTNYSKMVLANSITLTPGTLSVDVIGDTFYIHWIDVQSTDPEQAFKDIAEPFEKILLKIF